ncbi:hypothetical protein [Paenibacillus sp. UNC451MF]|uniref:hypothetical protein n=1 Tax=Paenibacillus sp. UNC451MF TaxID=1449063 RepID=UPI00048BDA22|nr:hypothetical protein [Paenibacillus sp. UNC451MF]
MHKRYRQTMIMLMLLSIFQAYISAYTVLFDRGSTIQTISSIGLLLQSLTVLTVTLLEWSFSESRWFHRAYKAATYIAVIGLGLCTSIFIQQGLFSIDSVEVLLSVITTVILIQKYNLLYKE